MDTTISASLPQPLLAAASGKSFGIRAAAYMIDTIVLVVSYLAVYTIILMVVAVGAALVSGQEFVPGEQDSNGLFNLFYFGLTALYFTLFEWLYGATPGKLILGMRVIKEDGSRCTLWAAFVRALFRLIDGLFFGLVAYATMKDERNQRLGDKSAGTIVVGSHEACIRQPKSWWWFVLAAGIYLPLNIVFALFWI